MILRRIGEAVRRQDWFVVLVEVLVVIFGVFIGLQVDDWNKARLDRADEKLFMSRFHDELLLSAALASRVRERRVALFGDLLSATDAIFDQPEQEALTRAECTAVGNARFFNINVSNFPSLAELQNSGRLSIIRDKELRFAIVELQEKASALKETVPLMTRVRKDLPNQFPNLINAAPYFDGDLQEYQERYHCDLEGMRESQEFRNAIALTVDGYDAYLRDGLLPWLNQFKKVHLLVDQELGIGHEGGSQ